LRAAIGRPDRGRDRTNGTDDTNDFQIEIVPADGTNAAAN
jgi:hypothetical protein